MVYSYLNTDDLLFRVARVSKKERVMVRDSRMIGNKQVRISIKESTVAASTTALEYIFDFSDRLILQSTGNFKQRNQLLSTVLSRMPLKFCEHRVRLYVNEISPDVISVCCQREVEFQEVYLYGASLEYTDKVD